MEFPFNLLDEPWIPCARDALAPPEEMSLRAVLLRAATISHIVEARPPTLIALHRMLLGLLHRALQGPRTPQEWRALWRQQSWDGTRLLEYLEEQHSRFNLFDDRYPFFQTPGMDPARAVAVSTLTYDRASNVNSPMIFDHQMDGAAIAPAEAARWLLGHHYFTTPGLISDDGPTGRASASGSPLLGSLVCLAQGRTLFETLLLNMVLYDPQPGRDLPFAFTGDDQPVWEREPVAGRTDREPTGYADWLTWPSRRILLLPERDAAGSTVVRRAVLMDGARTPRGFQPWHRETMVAYRKNPKADTDQQQSPYLAVQWNPERAIWRESHALLSGFASSEKPDEKIGPKVLDVLAQMEPADMRDYRVAPLLVAGVINNQKLVENWSQDSLAVSPKLLQSLTLVDAIRQALDVAETCGSLLAVRDVKVGVKGKTRPSPMKVLALEYVKGLGERVPQSKDYDAVADHLDSRRTYWAALAVPFHTFLREIATPATDDGEQGSGVDEGVQMQWLGVVKEACQAAFARAVKSLGESPRALRASAIAQASFAECCGLAEQAYRATWEGAAA